MSVVLPSRAFAGRGVRRRTRCPEERGRRGRGSLLKKRSMLESCTPRPDTVDRSLLTEWLGMAGISRYMSRPGLIRLSEKRPKIYNLRGEVGTLK